MATEFGHESFLRQQDSVNKRIEESLAKLIASVTGTRAKEPPDPVATPTQGWSLPPSVTKAPLGVRPESLPWIRLEPPRFDGENARDWIRKIQEYYNYHYTPLDDRLSLIHYLFDHPASDWLTFWMDNNSGKGWDDFLFAVKQRFDPNPLADYAGPVRKAHTSSSDLLTWSEAPSPAVSSTANVVRADQPVVEVCKVLIDGHITGEDAEILCKRNSCSGYSPKEMNDSGEGSTDSRAYDDNFKCRTSVGIVKRAPIIAGDGGYPRLLQKQKFACFDETSGGGDAAHMNQEPKSRQRTPYVAGETVWASKIPVNPIRHTPQNASSTHTWRPPPSRFEAAASLPSECRPCIQIVTPQFYGDDPLVPEGFVVDVSVGPLEVIDSSRNRFQGQIAEVNLSSTFCWSNLLHLDVSGNVFSGRFSTSLSRVMNLRHLNLAHNKFKEQELLKVDMLSGLEYLSLSTTNLIGEIPSNASHLGSLRIRDPSTNNFSNHIPGTIAKNLRVLDLSCSKVVGEISFMQELHELERFSFCGSRFSSEILQYVSVESVNSCLIAATSAFFQRSSPKHRELKLEVPLTLSMGLLLFLTFGCRSKASMWTMEQSSSKEELTILRTFSFHTDSTTWVADVKQAKTMLVNFTFPNFMSATSHLDRDTLLAEERFEPVYRGVLLEGIHVAVKVSFQMKMKRHNDIELMLLIAILTSTLRARWVSTVGELIGSSI